jgi:hypothetical protein
MDGSEWEENSPVSGLVPSHCNRGSSFYAVGVISEEPDDITRLAQFEFEGMKREANPGEWSVTRTVIKDSHTGPDSRR